MNCEMNTTNTTNTTTNTDTTQIDINIINFKTCVKNVVGSLGLGSQNWDNPKWRDTWQFLNQNVCNDAFDQLTTNLLPIFEKELGSENIEKRLCKTIKRLKEKEEQKSRGIFFKVVSDLMAFRVLCSVKEIASKIAIIERIVKAKNGLMYIRDSENNGGRYVCNDITQYVYVYFEEIGYPVEIQIGHPFAAFTFQVDSYLRDNPAERGKVVDLWTDDFYNLVKSFILADFANNKEARVAAKKLILDKAAEMHQERHYPYTLKLILENL
jgi:hypothetical protein